MLPAFCSGGARVQQLAVYGEHRSNRQTHPRATDGYPIKLLPTLLPLPSCEIAEIASYNV